MQDFVVETVVPTIVCLSCVYVCINLCHANCTNTFAVKPSLLINAFIFLYDSFAIINSVLIERSIFAMSSNIYPKYFYHYFVQILEILPVQQQQKSNDKEMLQMQQRVV